MARPFLIWHLLGLHPLKAPYWMAGLPTASEEARTDGLTFARDRHRKMKHEDSKAHCFFLSIRHGGFSRKSPVNSCWFLANSMLLTHRGLLSPAWPRARSWAFKILCALRSVPRVSPNLGQCWGRGEGLGKKALLSPSVPLPALLPLQGSLCHCTEVGYTAHSP